MNRPLDICPAERSTAQRVQDNAELDALCAIVAERRGLWLRVVDMPDAGGQARPPTMWLSSAVEDIVLINPEPPEHRGHVLAKELKQLLCDQGGSTDWLDVSQLLPDLDPAMMNV